MLLISLLPVPCPPTNLTVKTECATNLAILKWAPSRHAISYTVTLTGTHGHLVSCGTNKTTCSLKVDCAKQYSAFVVASSATCNSSKSDNLTFVSGTWHLLLGLDFLLNLKTIKQSTDNLPFSSLPKAPCLPDRVQAKLDCNANTFAVEWRGSLGDIDYTAIAIGSDKTRRTCNSSSTNCVIQNLTCGLIYSIVVTTSSIDCGFIEGSNYKIQSGSKYSLTNIKIGANVLKSLNKIHNNVIKHITIHTFWEGARFLNVLSHLIFNIYF